MRTEDLILIKFGQKTITFPHGYGYCQCGCVMKTVKLRNDIYASYRTEHHPLAIERKKRQTANVHNEFPQPTINVRLESTLQINKIPFAQPFKQLDKPIVKTNQLNQSGKKSFGLNVEGEKLLEMYFEEKKENIKLHKALVQAISMLIVATDYIDSFCQNESDSKSLILNLLHNAINEIPTE